MKKNKNGEIQLGRKTSILIMFVWGLFLFYLAFFAMTKFGLIDTTETTIITCENGDLQVWNGSGVYCGVYADSLEDLEKSMEPELENDNLDYGIQ